MCGRLHVQLLIKAANHVASSQATPLFGGVAWDEATSHGASDLFIQEQNRNVGLHSKSDSTTCVLNMTTQTSTSFT